jgi:excisionase family DNA binding protein
MTKRTDDQVQSDPTSKELIGMEKLLYRPKEAAVMLGIGRATLYDLMRSGRVRSVKDGGMRFITLDALRAYVRQLEDQAEKVT